MEEENQVPDVETPEAPESDTTVAEAPAAPEPTPLEQVWNADWMNAQIGALEASPLTAEEIGQLSHREQRLIAAVRAQAQAGVPEAQAKEKELREREQAAAMRERMVTRRAADVLKPFTDPRMQSFLDSLKPADEEPDYGTEEWVRWHADQLVAKRLGEMFAVMTEQAKANREAAEQAEREMAAAAARAEEEAWLEEHKEDFEDERVVDRVSVLVTKHHFTLPEALAIAQREVVAADDKANAVAARKASQERIARGGSRGPTLPDTPKSLDEAHEHYRRHPGAAKRDVERYERERFGR